VTLVCLDTHILIWGVLGEATTSQKDMVDRAQRFLRSLDKESARVLVPPTVVAELVWKVPEAKHPGVLRVLQQRFLLASLDPAGACLSAAIAQRNGGAVKSATGRETIRADCQIVAVALAYRVTRLYSNDPDIKRLAEGFVQVEEMPNVPEQRNLFPKKEGSP
jgi:predicted nucleic acid-binding protein